MSLLADMLSKVEQPETRREVPPNLKDIVQSSGKRSMSRNKIILLSIVFVIAVLAGFFIVYFARTLSENSGSSISIIPPPMLAASEEGIPAEKVVTHEAAVADKTRKSKPDEAENAVNKDVVQAAGAVEAVTPTVKEVSRKVDQAGAEVSAAAMEGSDALPTPAESEIIETTSVKPQKKASPQVTAIDASRRDGYLYSAREYEAGNDYSKSLAEYKKALAIDRNNPTILNSIAYVYLQFNLLKDSVKYSEKAVNIDSDYSPALINLGIAHAGLKNSAEADEYFSRALALNPDSQSVLFNLAILHERQKDYSKASEYYGQLMKYGNVNGTLGMARLYDRQNKTEEAVRLYRSVYALDTIDTATRTQVRQRIIVLLNDTTEKKSAD